MRLWDLDDLIGMYDIADMAGVGKPAASNWLRRHADFPRPVHHVSHGTKLFSRVAVKAWLASRTTNPKGAL